MRSLGFRTDSYKHSHWLQVPPGTTGAFFYLASRGGLWPTCTFQGLQGILKHLFGDPALHPMTMAHIHHDEPRVITHGEPYNRAGFERIVNVHQGYIPMRIRAVPEGLTVPTGNVMMTCESTDPQLHWVPGFFESPLERVWYPTGVCTQSREMKKPILRYLRKTSELAEALINSRLHDFGARGASSGETAAIGDCAHLVNFLGTDTMEGLEWAEEKYNEYAGDVGKSIPAMEHFTVTSWGREGEAAAYKNMLDKFATKGAVLACVSDSRDIWNAIDNIWCKQLKQQVIDSGALVVIRPDSGNPEEVIVKALTKLEAGYGSVTNKLGYKVLNNVAIIQGDGIEHNTIEPILEAVAKKKFSTGNVAFGSGGGLLQKINRDTQKVAYKGSCVTVNGVDVPINKDPVDDPWKASIPGKLDLIEENGKYRTVTITDGPHPKSVMRTVWENGRLLIDEKLSTIRERALVGLESL